MTALLIVALVLLTLLGLPLFIALAGGSLLATYNAGLDPALLIVELNRLASGPYLAAIPLFTFAGVVLAAGGYPDSYHKGDAIEGLEGTETDSTKVFHAGTTTSDGKVVTNAEFREIMDEKMKEMNEQFQSDGRRRSGQRGMQIRIGG